MARRDRLGANVHVSPRCRTRFVGSSFHPLTLLAQKPAWVPSAQRIMRTTYAPKECNPPSLTSFADSPHIQLMLSSRGNSCRIYGTTPRLIFPRYTFTCRHFIFHVRMRGAEISRRTYLNPCDECRLPAYTQINPSGNPRVNIAGITPKRKTVCAAQGRKIGACMTPTSSMDDMLLDSKCPI